MSGYMKISNFNTWKFIHSNIPAKNIHGFVCEKRALELELGMKFSFTHHQTCNFKLLLLQNFSAQSKLVLQWKHFLEINYPMFQIQGFVVLKRHRFQWRRISFRILWVVFFFLMSRNVWPRMFCQYSKIESMSFKHSEEKFFEMIFWFCCQFVDNCL